MVHRDIELSRLTGCPDPPPAPLDRPQCGAGAGAPRPTACRSRPKRARTTSRSPTSCCRAFDAVYKVNPPLRTADDIAALKVGLADGTIDAIATDHAPHPAEAKEQPLDQAPPGMLGLETALSLALGELDSASPRSSACCRAIRRGSLGSPIATVVRSRSGARRTSPCSTRPATWTVVPAKLGVEEPQHPVRRPRDGRQGPPHDPSRASRRVDGEAQR